MKPTINSRAATVITGIGLAATMLSVQAHGTEAGTAPMPTLASSALITIPDPKEASLLQLHGYSGTGTALIQLDGQCYSMPVRFVAGNFGGQGVAIGKGGPIRLQIVNAAMVQALHQGRDLVSEGRAVAAGSVGDAPDIVIEAGVPAGTGFVINAGSSVLADVFGARPRPVPCRATDAATTASD